MVPPSLYLSKSFISICLLLIHQVGSGVCLSKSKLLHYLLEGTAASHVESINGEEKDAIEDSNHEISAGRMVYYLPCLDSMPNNVYLLHFPLL